MGLGLGAAGAGWGGVAEWVDGTKPIWGEVVWGEGVREGGSVAGVGGSTSGAGSGAAAASALSFWRASRARRRGGGGGGWGRGGTGFGRGWGSGRWRTVRGGFSVGRCICCRSDIARFGF